MRFFLYLAALLLAFAGGILCTSCATSHPPADAPAAPVTRVGGLVARDSAGRRVDSLSPKLVKNGRLADKPGVLARLFNKSNGTTKQSSTVAANGISSPKKCKGCVFNVVAGNQANTTTAKKATTQGDGNTTIDKAKAPVATGAATATDQRGSGVKSAIDGDGNAPVLTNIAPEAPGVGATIAAKLTGPLGVALALLAVAATGYGIYYFWWLIPARRQKPTENQA